jgi:hypothetical protein
MKASKKYEVEIIRPSDCLDEWDGFVDESPQGCIFCRPWWLRAVCPDGFEILTLRKGGKIVAGMPMVVSRKLGQRIIHMPQLTQTLGVLLAPPTKQSYVANLSAEMELLKKLVRAIPTFSYFSMNFHYNFTNWLPLYWAGYRQTTRYTYVIPYLGNETAIWKELRSNTKGDIRKASKRGLGVESDGAVWRFYDVNKKTFSRQGIGIPYSQSFFERLDQACQTKGAAKTLSAVDKSGRTHASCYIVWDSKAAYYLAGGGDPDLRNSGATSLLIWESIKFASTVAKRFDFEGSMIPSVERFFRAFGARQMPYFNISKDNRSLAVRACFALRHKAGVALRSLGLRK